MLNTSKFPRLVFDFVRSPVQRLAEVKNEQAPKESLLGYIQLKERGWPVSASDDRWNGFTGRLRTRIRHLVELPSYRMIQHWRQSDIIVVTTRISIILALIAKLLQKKLVFLDAMCEEVPKNALRRFTTKQSLRLADAVICYSASQAQHWANVLKIPREIFTPLDYFVDHEFYKLPSLYRQEQPPPPYILSVGRDPSRDFNTLAAAANLLGLELKLVTLPYLVPEIIRNNLRVQVLERLSYDQLFNVYANAKVVVVPIKHDTTYMSGIRATMDAMLLEVPVVASRISGMEDYFVDGEELVFFEPEDTHSLIQAIHKILKDNSFRDSLVKRARQKVINSYSLTKYADALEKIFRSL